MHGIAGPTLAELGARREAADHVLGYLREEGHPQPGGFTTKVIDAMFLADRTNFAKLSLGFPYLAEAVRQYKHVGGVGVEAVKEWADLS